MDKYEIIESISHRGNGEIYLGVVGAVRTGKSTFIKRFIENLVVPNIDDEYEKKRCLDEIPQSAQGKTIMTTEPKFVPSNGATIKIEEFETKIRLIDCVGYVIPGVNGFEDENKNPRMVKTPWYEDNLPFVEAAEIGTEKVIKDHSMIGIVVTSDGSFGEIKREEYLIGEERVVKELREIGKPFIVVLNTTDPNSSDSQRMARELKENYQVPVIPVSVDSMKEKEIYELLKEALYEFPVIDIEVSMPEWITVLNDDHYIKKHYFEKIRESVQAVNKLRDIDEILFHFKDSEFISKSYISKFDAKTGIVTINLESSTELYNNVLQSIMGETKFTKANILKVFNDFSSGNNEIASIKSAMKMAKSTGYGIVYPSLNEMSLDTPEIIRQGNRYGIKLKAVANSYHIRTIKMEWQYLIDGLMQGVESHLSLNMI